jgi:hypothetical protein
MDSNNPGVLEVEGETYGNPDPNGGTAEWRPMEDDVLVVAEDEAYPAAGSGIPSSVFPTPTDVLVTGVAPLLPVLVVPVPTAPSVDVSSQDLGKGTWAPVDPLDPAQGMEFVPPGEFLVLDSVESIQTNQTDQDTVLLAVQAVLDADTLGAPGTNTTRYYLRVAVPPFLTSYRVPLGGRQVTFADDTTTAADRGANRVLTGYGRDFVVVNRTDVTVDNGSVETLALPAPGDTLWIDVGRQGAEDVDELEDTPLDYVVFPPPPPFAPSPAQALQGGGTFDVSTLAAPGQGAVGSGVQVPPTLLDARVADQSPVVGMPTNVFV